MFFKLLICIRRCFNRLYTYSVLFYYKKKYLLLFSSVFWDKSWFYKNNSWRAFLQRHSVCSNNCIYVNSNILLFLYKTICKINLFIFQYLHFQYLNQQQCISLNFHYMVMRLNTGYGLNQQIQDIIQNHLYLHGYCQYTPFSWVTPFSLSRFFLLQFIYLFLLGFIDFVQVCHFLKIILFCVLVVF